MKNKNDLAATLLGGGAGAVILSQVDLVKLGSLDRTELAKVGLAVLIVGLGWVTNKVHPA